MPPPASAAPPQEVEEFSFGDDSPEQNLPVPASPEVHAEAPATSLPLEAPEEPEFAGPDSSPVASSESNAFAEISAQLPGGAHHEPEAREQATEAAGPSEVEEIAFDLSSLEQPAAEQPAVKHAESLEDHLASLHQPDISATPPATHAATPAPVDQPLELELDQDYELVLDAEPLVPAYDQKPPEIPLVVDPSAGEAAHAHEGAPADSAPAEPFLLPQKISPPINSWRSWLRKWASWASAN